MEKRFFIVSYAHDGGGFGNSVTSTENGAYFDQRQFTEHAKKATGHKIAIIAVAEISEKDAIDFMA